MLLPDLFNIARTFLCNFRQAFFSKRLVYPYNRIDTITAWKELCFILSDKFDFHMINNLLIAVHAFASRILMSFSVEETLVHSKLLGTTNIHTTAYHPQTNGMVERLHFSLKPLICRTP